MANPPPASLRRKSPIGTLLRGIFFAGTIGCLGATLALQTTLLVRGSWELPDFLLRKLHDELEERGWSASYSSLAFRPTGTILIRDLQLTRLADRHPFATAPFARVEFDLWELLSGNLRIEHIVLQEGGIFCPPHLSPSGVSEAVVRDTHIAARHLPGGWEIESFNGRVHNLSFSLTGPLPDLPSRAGEKQNLDELLDLLLPRLVREKDFFHQAKDPHLKIVLVARPDSDLSIQTEAFAESFVMTSWVRASKLRVYGEWTLHENKWKATNARMEASHIRVPPFSGDLADVRGSLGWDHPIDGLHPLIPTRFALTVGQLASSGVTLDEVQIAGHLTSPTGGTVDLFSLLADGSASAKFIGDWDRGNARLEVTAQATPNMLMPALRDLGLRYDVFFHRAPIIHATAEIRKWQLVEAVGTARAGAVDIDGVLLDRATATASFDGKRFVVPEMVLAYQDFEATGIYDVDLAKRSYRLLFQGSLRPLHISTWFRPWWTDLWQQFSFEQSPLHGDVDIHGMFRHSDSVDVVGTVQASDFSLKGVSFQEVAGDLRVWHDRADFFNIRARRADGHATGEFQFFESHPLNNLPRVRFKAESRLDPVELAPIFGPEGAAILAPFRFTSAPELEIEGAISPSAPELTRVTFKGEAAAPLHYEGVPLEWLRLQGAVTGADWHLSEIVAGVAGGSANASARKWTEDGAEKFSFILGAEQLNLATATDIMDGWQADRGGPGRTMQRSGLNGVIDLDVAATGDFGDLLSYDGTGKLRIREADLAEVHLLGLLSRILSVTPLAFTSLQFSEADSDFQIQKERIHFPNLRLLGPSSALRATGDYRLDRQDLDFSVKLFLLKESRLPFISILLSPLLEPLAHITEIRLIGPAADPQWRFLLGPRNILEGIAAPPSEAQQQDL